MIVDALATSSQYAEHLRPIWDALEPEERGLFLDRMPRRRKGETLPSGTVCIVSSYGDYKRVCHTRLVANSKSASVLRIDAPKVPVVLFEHGAGFTYLDNPRKPNWGGSYAGGPMRDHVSLFMCTNRWVQEANQRKQPDVPAPIVGCAKLDELVRIPKPENDHPVLAFSFHWECPVWPETKSAKPHFQEGLVEFARWAKDEGIEVLGHGHPRVQTELRSLWRRLGWEFVPSFRAVCERADVYVCDTSSTIYEFAALDRPVVLLNAPWYRRDVHHGIRFWDAIDVGIQCDEPEDLQGAVQRALADTPLQRERRHAAVNEVYPYLGRSVHRAVEVLRDFAG